METSWRSRLQVHPVAQLFPQLPSQDFADLVASIKQNGLLNKIALWEDRDGTVYLADGRHRASALEQLGISLWDGEQLNPTYTELWTGDVSTRIVAENICRRHLTPAQRVELALQAVTAARQFEQQHRVKGGHKRVGTVSRVAASARVSKPTAYQYLKNISPGCYKPQRDLKPQIAQLMADPSKLPPDGSRRNGHGGGKRKSVEGKVAIALGVSLPTVRRNLAQMEQRSAGNGNGHHFGHHFNGGYGKRKAPTIVVPEAKHLTDEDLSLAKAIRSLEAVSGADLSSWGLSKLSVVESHVGRIRREYAQEAEVEHDVIVEAATPS